MDRKKKRQSLTKQLATLEKKLACINLQASNAVKIIEKVNIRMDEIKSQLKIEGDKDIKGMILHSKARYYEEGEKNTRYFFSLEKTNARNKIMSSVINDQGKLITEGKSSLKEQRDFYQKLYTSNAANIL